MPFPEIFSRFIVRWDGIWSEVERLGEITPLATKEATYYCTMIGQEALPRMLGQLITRPVMEYEGFKRAI